MSTDPHFPLKVFSTGKSRQSHCQDVVHKHMFPPHPAGYSNVINIHVELECNKYLRRYVVIAPLTHTILSIYIWSRLLHLCISQQ